MCSGEVVFSNFADYRFIGAGAFYACTESCAESLGAPPYFIPWSELVLELIEELVKFRWNIAGIVDRIVSRHCQYSHGAY